MRHKNTSWQLCALVRSPSLICGTRLAAECRTCIGPGVFCIVLCREIGDRLVRAEKSVETSHSTTPLCSLDPSQ